MELKQKAVSLRQQGLTYKEIVSALDGAVSVDWCKKNLKGVTRVQKKDECLQELIALGVRPCGVTEYEANKLIFKYHHNATKDKLRYIKDKAKEMEPKCLIHSGWIDPMMPRDSHKAMNAFVLHLMDHVEELVEDYRELYPNTNEWAVKHEMLKLAFSSKISPESLGTRLFRNEKLAETLEDRWMVSNTKGCTK